MKELVVILIYLDRLKKIFPVYTELFTHNKGHRMLAPQQAPFKTVTVRVELISCGVDQG